MPALFYLPESKDVAPVIVFSHGLGGSRNGSAYLGKHWAARGYVAAFIQHPGSDESVIQDLPPLQKISALKKAANLRSSLDRARDVSALLDQLKTWNRSDSHQLRGRMDLEKIGMSGHSYGAVTTQAISGQSNRRGSQRFQERRIKAALPMSPSVPRNIPAETAFGKVNIPWLLMTGTEDGSPISGMDPSERLGVYPALPRGQKYELVLWKAEHSAFTERRLPGDREQRNPNHHKAILAISTAFWDSYLKEDSNARTWLDGKGAESVLFTYFHFAASEELTRAMIKTKAIAIAYETIQLSDGSLPLLTPMSEVAGRMAIQQGAKYLEREHGGQ